MAVKIRLFRMGTNKKPFYRLVATDVRSGTRGRFLENIGWYDPKQAGENYKLKLDRVDYWLENGAEASETAKSLIRKARKAEGAAPVAAEPAPAEEVAAETAEEKTEA